MKHRTVLSLLLGLGPLMLVLMLSSGAAASCPSAFNLDFSGTEYTDCFRELLRGRDINTGADLGSTGHTAVNFTGGAGSAGSTWLTVYDKAPTDVAANTRSR